MMRRTIGEAGLVMANSSNFEYGSILISSFRNFPEPNLLDVPILG
jgi:hypothetical protein